MQSAKFIDANLWGGRVTEEDQKFKASYALESDQKQGRNNHHQGSSRPPRNQGKITIKGHQGREGTRHREKIKHRHQTIILYKHAHGTLMPDHRLPVRVSIFRNDFDKEMQADTQRIVERTTRSKSIRVEEFLVAASNKNIRFTSSFIGRPMPDSQPSGSSRYCLERF